MQKQIKNIKFTIEQLLNKQELSQLLKQLPIQLNQEFVKKYQQLIKQHKKNKQTLEKLIRNVVEQFNQSMVLAGDLILKTLSTDDKYHYQSEIQPKPQVVQQSVIALPYYEQNPNPVIIVHSANQNEDTRAQRFSQSALFKEDQILLNSYKKQPFEVIKRENIGAEFTNMAKIIISNLRILDNRSLQYILKYIEIIDYISPAIYTMCLSQMTKKLAISITKYFEQLKGVKFYSSFKKEKFEQSIYSISSLCQRWRDNDQKQYFQCQSWQFQLKTSVIERLLNSQISQQQLYSVKTLGQICRRSDIGMSGPTAEQMLKFIEQKQIIPLIYKINNHPQVIAKGKQTIQFISKNSQLTQQQLSSIFNLLDKTHEQLCKVLYATIQSIGQKNLQLYRSWMMKQILAFPRASCFFEDTFVLIEMLILLTPMQTIEQSLKLLYGIMQKHYNKLKQNLKQKIIDIYFELFIIGVEEKMFQNELTALKPILMHLQSQLAFLMIQSFVQLLQRQKGKRIQTICNKIMIETIKTLFLKYNFHKINLPNNRKKQLNLLIFLLDIYCTHTTNQELILNYSQLSQLINEQHKFSKFIVYFPKDNQLQVLKRLIKDNKNFLEVYQLVDKEVQQSILPEIKESFFHEKSYTEQKLSYGKIYMRLTKIKIDQIIEGLKCNNNIQQNLILLKLLVQQSDKNGYGQHTPFSLYGKAQQVRIKVINSLDVLAPIQFVMIINSHKTVKQLIIKLIDIINTPISKLKIKISDKFLTINDFQSKIVDICPYQQMNLEIYQSAGCQWFDKCQLLYEGKLNENVNNALKDIYKNFSENGKMYRKNVAKVFQIATQAQRIQIADARIIHIFCKYSDTNQYLTISEWLAFYFQSAIMTPSLVVENLKRLGYGYLFKQPDFLNFQSQQNMTRNLIKQSQQVLNSIIINADDKYIKLCIELLKLLPINSNILVKLTNFAQIDVNSIKFQWYISSLIGSLLQGKDGSIKQKQAWQQKLYTTQLYEQLLNNTIRMINQLRFNEQFEVETIINITKLELQRYKIPKLSESDISNFQPVQITMELNLNEIDFNILVSKLKKDMKLIENILSLYLLTKFKKDITINNKLIFHSTKQLRIIFNNFYYLLSTKNSNIKQQYYSSIPSQECQEYFNIIIIFLQKQNDDSFYEKFANDIIQKLIDDKQRVEKIMLGRMQVLNLLKLYNPNLKLGTSWLQIIQPYCLTQVARDIYYQLCHVIYTGQQNIRKLSQMIKGVKLKKNSICKWNTTKQRMKKNYIGLYNLGCICYINSILQQLFMIKPFRNAILSQKQLQELKSEQNKYFPYFQKIFYYLAFGERSFYIAEDFCENYISWDNKPINIKQQHDADEFLNQLLDRVQQSINKKNQFEKDQSNTQVYSVIKQNLCGQLCNIIECQSCLTKKCKIQDFYILSLQIKGLKSLEECLSKQIEPTIIAQFFCETCERKVEQIHKYHNFHTLPKYLFIHLQRLVFDLETFSKIKLDHIIQFPQIIDLASYFDEQLQIDNESFKEIYHLRGFIVHIGTSQSGHYYSLIKDGKQWIKFDDNRVDQWNWEHGYREKQNAYMLIYEKYYEQQVSQSKEIIEPLKLNISLVEQIEHDNMDLRKQLIVLQHSFPKYIEKSLNTIQLPKFYLENISLAQISSPNNLLVPYHPNYSVEEKKVNNNLKTSIFLILDYFSIISQIKENGLQHTFSQTPIKPSMQINSYKIEAETIKRLTCYLVFYAHLLPQYAEQILKKIIESHGIQILVGHNDPTLRQVYKLVLIKFMSIVTNFQTEHLLLAEIPNQQMIVSKKMMLEILVSLETIGKHYNKMNEYFQFVLKVCQMSKYCVQWFHWNNLGPKLVHFILQSDSPLKNEFKTMSNFASSKKVEAYNTIFKILQFLVFGGISEEKKWSELEIKAYTHFEFYQKMLKQHYNYHEFNRILCYFCKDNEQLTNKLIHLLLSSLNRIAHTDPYIYAYLHLLHGFILIDDQYQKKRLEILLGVPVLNLNLEKFNSKECFVSTNKRLLFYNSAQTNQGDQYYLPLLQLLYLNKNDISYFSVLGILTLLRSMNSQKISHYIFQIPSSKSSPSIKTQEQIIDQIQLQKTQSLIKISILTQGYLQWIGQFLQNALNDKIKSLGEIDEHELVNQIAEKFKNLEDKDDALTQYSKFWQILLSYKNIPSGKYLVHEVQKIKQYEFISCQLYEYDDKPQFIKMQIKNPYECQIQFTFWNYNYTFYYPSGQHQLLIPYANNYLDHINVVLKQNIIHQPSKQEKPQQATQPMQQQKFNVQQQFGYYCPFCCAGQKTFTSKCQNCGEDWGEMY